MPVLTTLLTILAPAVAKTILSSWLQERTLATAVGEEIIDKLKDLISDSPGQKTAQRSIEAIAKQIAEQMRPIFNIEAASLSENSRNAILLDIAATLRQADVTSELLMSCNLDAKPLMAHLRKAYPEAGKHFNRNETALYERMLEEVSLGIISVAPQLEGFTVSYSAETLHRLEELAQTITTLYEQSRREAADFASNYRNSVKRELDKLEIFGLPAMNNITSRQSLSNAFVKLSAICHSQDERDREAEILSQSLTAKTSDSDQQEEQLNSRRSKPIDETIASSRRLVIRGDAGAGKSTLLQWLAVRAANQSFPPNLAHWNHLIPFFIRLRSWVNDGFPTPEKFPQRIADNFVETMPRGWVHQCLKVGSALVLIDGVDELPREQRQAFFERLQSLVEDFPNARYIVTSRPAGLKDAQGEIWQEWETWTEKEKFLNLSLESMNSTDIEQFITQWHDALKNAKRPEDESIDLTSTASNLQRLLRQRSELRRLATTPLLCAMICALHRERADNLPTERITLYRDCIDMLLNRRDQGRKVPLELEKTYPAEWSESRKMALIQSFAYWLMENNFSDTEKNRVDAHFDRRLQLMNLPKEVTGAKIRDLFVERAALLREPVIGRIDFAHRTFQEYLTAKAALDEDSINVLLQRAQDDLWREAIIVAAGLARRKECNELLRNLLQQGNDTPDKRHYLHLLAVACLETSVEVDPDVRKEVLNQAQALLPPKDEDEVGMVARAGDAIVPLLAPNPNYYQDDAVYCVQALAKIGSSAAMAILTDYAKSTSYDLTESLCKAWNDFDRSAYAQKVLSQTNSNRIIAYDLASGDGFEYLNHISFLKIVRPKLADFSPLKNLTNLTQLEIDYENTNSHGLSTLRDFSNLTSLRLRGDAISDLSPLATLSNLTSLRLRGDAISDLSPLATLSNLTNLDLSGDVISDISPLATLSNLTNLDLSGEAIIDISPLATLSNLTYLDLSGEAIIDISPLATLSNLTNLNLSGGKISDISPLATLSNLTNLDLSGDEISDLSSLATLSNLTTLILSGGEISDLSPLATLSNLTTLILSGDVISDLSSLATLSNLTILGLFGGEISDLSPLATLSNLTTLGLSRRATIDLSPLAQLTNLNIERL
ncbi:Rab family protein (plasmid) [Cylindrospermum sp. NIES-4074]|nr:Rab family protein [Cylindrospermum sp. NIES-4074]